MSHDRTPLEKKVLLSANVFCINHSTKGIFTKDIDLFELYCDDVGDLCVWDGVLGEGGEGIFSFCGMSGSHHEELCIWGGSLAKRTCNIEVGHKARPYGIKRNIEVEHKARTYRIKRNVEVGRKARPYGIKRNIEVEHKARTYRIKRNIEVGHKDRPY
ncbi:MAG: hypothetical protein CL920_29050 [Deltaproteobacteria bacterium]|nr:hypothetical protein [Deltaproteobacteria bacterium]